MKSVLLIREPNEKLWNEFEAASREVKKAVVNAQQAENRYSITYQNLVKNNGCVMQIKRKYR